MAKERIPITLTEQDRERLRILADAQGVSLAEAARRAILAEHERRQEAEVRPRIEDPLRVEMEQMKAKLAELDPLVVGTSLRLLALINCSKGRAEIEAELTRLVRA